MAALLPTKIVQASDLSIRDTCPSRILVRLDLVAIFPSGRLASGHV